jgi:hypothetical protein
MKDVFIKRSVDCKVFEYVSLNTCLLCRFNGNDETFNHNESCCVKCNYPNTK